ncbi:hypothetical protein THAR02_11148 [Trichoderma harzianum]|uniref:Uncharacterized protein n=1 Tax=Trichoderma harzianum TaxID=5544 RepID=A0A0F9X7E7_TRIHA|nr:hypothetical protein THAR02_11148 [Trichoderma harzianum]
MEPGPVPASLALQVTTTTPRLMSLFPHAGLLTHRLDPVHDALQQHQRGFSKSEKGGGGDIQRTRTNAIKLLVPALAQTTSQCVRSPMPNEGLAPRSGCDEPLTRMHLCQTGVFFTSILEQVSRHLVRFLTLGRRAANTIESGEIAPVSQDCAMMTDRTEIECTKSNAPPVHAYSVQVIVSFLTWQLITDIPPELYNMSLFPIASQTLPCPDDPAREGLMRFARRTTLINPVHRLHETSKFPIGDNALLVRVQIPISCNYASSPAGFGHLRTTIQILATANTGNLSHAFRVNPAYLVAQPTREGKSPGLSAITSYQALALAQRPVVAFLVQHSTN